MGGEKKDDRHIGASILWYTLYDVLFHFDWSNFLRITKFDFNIYLCCEFNECHKQLLRFSI